MSAMAVISRESHTIWKVFFQRHGDVMITLTGSEMAAGGGGVTL